MSNIGLPTLQLSKLMSYGGGSSYNSPRQQQHRQPAAPLGHSRHPQPPPSSKPWPPGPRLCVDARRCPAQP